MDSQGNFIFYSAPVTNTLRLALHISPSPGAGETVIHPLYIVHLKKILENTFRNYLEGHMLQMSVKTKVDIEKP